MARFYTASDCNQVPLQNINPSLQETSIQRQRNEEAYQKYKTENPYTKPFVKRDKVLEEKAVSTNVKVPGMPDITSSGIILVGDKGEAPELVKVPSQNLKMSKCNSLANSLARFNNVP